MIETHVHHHHHLGGAGAVPAEVLWGLILVALLIAALA